MSGESQSEELATNDVLQSEEHLAGDIYTTASRRLSTSFEAIAELQEDMPGLGRTSSGVHEGLPLRAEVVESKANKVSNQDLLVGIQAALDNSVVPQLAVLDKYHWTKFVDDYQGYRRKRGATKLLDCFTMEVLDLLPFVLRKANLGDNTIDELATDELLAVLNNVFLPLSLGSAVEKLKGIKMKQNVAPSQANLHRYISQFLKLSRDMEGIAVSEKTKVQIFLAGLTEEYGVREKVKYRLSQVDREIKFSASVEATLDEGEVVLTALEYFPKSVGEAKKSVNVENSAKIGSARSQNSSSGGSADRIGSNDKKGAPFFLFKPEAKGCFNCGLAHPVFKCNFKLNEEVVEKNRSSMKKYLDGKFRDGARKVSTIKASQNSDSDCPVISGHVGCSGIRAEILVDTGANICLMSPKFLAKLQRLDQLEIVQDRKEISLANGAKEILDQSVEVEVEILVDGICKSLKVKCFVMNISYDIIMNHQMSMKFGCVSVHSNVIYESSSGLDSVSCVHDGSRDKGPHMSIVPEVVDYDDLPGLLHCEDDVDESDDDFPDLISCDDSDVNVECPGFVNTLVEREVKVEVESNSWISDVPDWMPKISASLPECKSRTIVEMCNEFSEVFDVSAFPGVRVELPKFEIKLRNDALLPRISPRRLSPAMENMVREEVDSLLELGVIRESSSRYASPIVMVLSPEGKRRMCVDFRVLNEATEPMVYPMRNMKALVNRLQGKKYFATMDLFKGYHQLLVAEDTIPLLAFCVPWGLYEYVRMPFGPKNGCAVFQQAMDHVLADLLFTVCELFVDDLIVYGDTMDELTMNIRTVLERMKKVGLRVRGSKCQFGVTCISYLGFEITRDGYRMTAKRKEAINKIAVPKNRKELRSFVGMINYFHDFVPNFSVTCKPLFAAATGKTALVWSDELNTVFELVKIALLESRLLFFIDYEYPIVLRTDASNVGLGGVLFQVVSGKHRIVTYLSKAFDAVQRRWATVEQEADAIFYCVLGVAHFVLGHRFTIQTDHRNLLYMEKAQAPKLIRWRLRLQEFDYVIEHIRGPENEVADVLSRLHLAEGSDSVVNSVSNSMVCALEVGDLNEVIKEFHGGVMGHRGVHATLKMMWDRGIHFPEMKKHVSKYVKSCAACQKLSAVGSPPCGMSSPIVATEPFQCVMVDTIGPLPKDDFGHSYVLVIMDSFTRFVNIFPTVSTTAEEAVSGLVAVFGLYGMPQSILSDNGSQFANKLLSLLCESLHIEKCHSVPYRSEGNGQVERVNKEVMRHLRALIFDFREINLWSKYLSLVQHLVNNTTHSVLGVSPSCMLFGKMVSSNRGFFDDSFPVPTEVTPNDYVAELYLVQMNLMETSRKHQVEVDRVRLAKIKNAAVTVFVSGELVLLSHKRKIGSKLSVNWTGPFVIGECRTRTYLIEPLNDRMKAAWVDVERLKLYVKSESTESDSSVVLRDNDTFIVESIKEHHGKGNRRSTLRFLVKWEGYGDEENTWQGSRSLVGVTIFEDYCKVNKLH